MYEGPMGSNLSKISLISNQLPIYSVLDRDNKDFLRQSFQEKRKRYLQMQ